MDVIQIIGSLSPIVIFLFTAVGGVIIWRMGKIESKIDNHIEDGKDVMKFIHQKEIIDEIQDKKLEKIERKLFNGHTPS